MGKFALLCAALVLAIVAEAIDYDELLWRHFKVKYNKVYRDRAQEQEHRQIFLTHWRLVKEFNAAQSHRAGFTLGLYGFADQRLNNLLHLAGLGEWERPLESSQSAKFIETILAKNVSVPDELDWRIYPDRVRSVKQQFCSSGWAFAAAGALEGQLMVGERVKPGGSVADERCIDLSVQDLIDCAYNEPEKTVCTIGTLQEAFNYIDAEGLNNAKDYPVEYKRHILPCRHQKSKVALQSEGTAILPEDEQVLKQVVAKYGPVATVIEAKNPIFFYSSGIYDDEGWVNFTSTIRQAVLVIGYGSDQNFGDFWILKNSWGPTWGEGGFIRTPRNRNNMLGIASEAMIPIV